MKILHCCLANYYIDDYGYQENILPKINHKDGHDVLIIASTETIVDGVLTYTGESEYCNEDCVSVIRLPYTKWLPHFISKKLRIIPKFRKELYKFDPDTILFHSPCSFELITAARYKKNNPSKRLYVDTHAGYYNSGLNIFSKYILHKVYYKMVWKLSRNYVDKLFYIGTAEKEFAQEMYGVRDEELEFYPLGGEITPLSEKTMIRTITRKELGISENKIVFFHSGKLSKEKKTEKLIRAFSSINSNNFVLLIAGVMYPSTEPILSNLINFDDRIKFLGWKNQEQLRNLLCSTDMYLQPGTVSATLQNAICCGNPIMIYPHECYNHLIANNCISVKTIKDIEDAFNDISNGNYDLKQMERSSYEIAYKYLDYNKHAKRLYE